MDIMACWRRKVEEDDVVVGSDGDQSLPALVLEKNRGAAFGLGGAFR